MPSVNSLFDKSKDAKLPSNYDASIPRIRVLTKILYDPGMLIADRVNAYEQLSKIDPKNFKPTSRVALIHSVTRGTIARSIKGIADIKKAQEVIAPVMTPEYKTNVEDILFDPKEPIKARIQAYRELSNFAPKDYPKLNQVALTKSLIGGEIQEIAANLHSEYISPKDLLKQEEKKIKEEKPEDNKDRRCCPDNLYI